MPVCQMGRNWEPRNPGMLQVVNKGSFDIWQGESICIIIRTAHFCLSKSLGKLSRIAGVCELSCLNMENLSFKGVSH